MAVSERCRASLKMLEVSFRDEHAISELSPMTSCSDILLLVNGKKPSLLEEVELLDTLATYLAVKGEEDSKTRIFYELFPLDKEVPEYNLRFLIKLCSLALCIGLYSILELAAVWLKTRVSQTYAAAVHSLNYQNALAVYQLICTFLLGLNSDMLTIPGLPGTSSYLNETSDVDNESHFEHPLIGLPCNSPAFTDAYLSGMTLAFGHSPTLISALQPAHSLQSLGPPPPPLIHCITEWLHSSRIHSKPHHTSSSGHPATWTALDWPALLRMCKNSFSNYSVAEHALASCPPLPICLAWWTVFGPLQCQAMKQFAHSKDSKPLPDDFAGLHYELLQCLMETGSSTTSSGTHRHVGGAGSSGASGSGGSVSTSTFTNWFLPCFRKLEHTKEFHCLELLVRHTLERCSLGTNIPSWSFDEVELDNKKLVMIRVAEFLQIAWASGRIRNLSSDDFSKLLSPLTGCRLLDLLRARFKR
ncbi:hypothetical protein P879_07251 [Paragonimus westermani]|uniref:Uncharacterized protein n=1 Tax=Paragonimus westermani TaxID=34504 RepID=A0A8T0DH89_9TREM|nr:hypothetical protein P879_07251 [Paragonimus westermani]